jgi:hypothetical protein
LSTLFSNAHVVTMDEAGTEYEDGWILVDDGLVPRTDSLELGGADDLVAGLVFSGPHRVDCLYVGGEEVVRDGHLARADETEIAKEHRVQAERFAL